jgi:hypothetical protein
MQAVDSRPEYMVSCLLEDHFGPVLDLRETGDQLFPDINSDSRKVEAQ